MLFNDWQQIEEYYQSSTSNPSEDTLLQHFGGSHIYKEIAHLNSIDVDYLNCRASQNTIDIWHLSGKSQQEFIQTQLINFEPHSKSIYSSFIAYLTQFTHLFYSPLQLYLSNEPDLLLGDVNNLIEIIFQIIDVLQQQHVEPHCNLHLDLECVYKYNTKPCPFRPQADDDEFDVVPTLKTNDSAPAKDQRRKPDLRKGKVYDLEKEDGMNRILSELIVSITKSYHHYALALNGTNLKSSELSTSIPRPRCCIEYSPLCKLYNTIKRMKNTKSEADKGLITISFHKYSDHLCLYLFCRDTDGKVHGQRIFPNELTTVLVKVFKDPVVTKQTLSALGQMQFKEDADFKKFANFLKEQQSEEKVIVQQDEHDIFEYNKYKDINHGDLWGLLNPDEITEDEQDNEGVVMMSIGSYIFVTSESEGILFEDGDKSDKESDDEYIEFEIGENLSVQSDWSDDDE